VQENARWLRPSAAPKPGKIGPVLLLHLQNAVTPILAILFLKSVESGIVPVDWKIVNVTPLFEKWLDG
jgi:hypothetical protein